MRAGFRALLVARTTIIEMYGTGLVQVRVVSLGKNCNTLNHRDDHGIIRKLTK